MNFNRNSLLERSQYYLVRAFRHYVVLHTLSESLKRQSAQTAADRGVRAAVRRAVARQCRDAPVTLSDLRPQKYFLFKIPEMNRRISLVSGVVRAVLRPNRITRSQHNL
eukprot:1976649-Pleurochrysis_carterae.AAC.4